ncbi:MAG: efflux RND transporter permease subunit [Candidatus Omnitrophica bacterium]|nr:efflux RND transporter permease subunit [Candidatus Omnitrophota bacterium]
MIEFFVKRPVTTIMFVLFFVVLGIVAMVELPIEKNPKMQFPIITVSVEYPGATPLEMETLVIKKIEDAVSELSEIEKIRSQSFDNFGFIYIEFLLSADVNVKSIEVKDKVEAILNDLPQGIKKPVIEKYDPLIEPVMELVLSSHDLDATTLYEYADKTLRTALSSVEGVAKVDVYGGQERQIRVRLDPALLKQNYLSITEVIAAVAAKNTNLPGGLMEQGDSSLNVRFIGEFQSVDEIADLTVSARDGTQVPLRRIGTVEDSFKKIESMARYNGRAVIGLSLNKVSDGNSVRIAEAVSRRLSSFRDMLPAGMQLDIATDTTTFIVNETRGAEWNIVLGILLTVGILYLFTGEAKLTFIAAVVIPTSLISCFAAMGGSGFTINFVTLLAIATALGTLIANAIVIIENVLAHLEHQEDAVSAAISATKEVAGAVLASTGTNLVVFTPLAMMGGIVGLFMRQFGLTVIYATLFSLVASFSLTPMLCGLLLKKRPQNSPERRRNFNPFYRLSRLVNAGVDFLLREYRYVFDWQFRYPKTTIALTVGAVLSLRFILPYIDSTFVPQADEDKINIALTLPQGSTIERTLAVVKEVEARIDQIPEKASYLTRIGENGVENATLTVDLIPSMQRRRSDMDLINELIPFLAQIPDTEAHIIRGTPIGSETGDVSVNVFGLDYDTMIDLAEMMKTEMEKSGYFRSVSMSYKTPKPEIQFIPLQEKLLEYGVIAAAAGAALRASLYGNDENIYKEKGEEYEIHIELADESVKDIEDLSDIALSSRLGLVPLTALGTVRADYALPTIMHRDRKRIIRLEGYLSKSSLGHVSGVLAQRFRAVPFPSGYGYDFVGNSEHQAETGREIGKAFMLAVILTYMLLAALMNSVVYPIPIMTTVATSFTGVFAALFFLDQSMNVASMLGMVMLVGLVVNNAILMLDYALLKMKEGLPVQEALWLGASVKFRAIIMSSLAVALGVVPQLWALTPEKRSMGAVMIGGMLASIVLTFVFVPVVFWYIERFRRRSQPSRIHSAW